MDNAVRRVFLSWGLLVLPFITLAQSIEVEIRRASEISRDPAIVEAQRLVGDVLLSVGEAEVVCDSAWRYPTGRFRLMGRVEATVSRHPDRRGAGAGARQRTGPDEGSESSWSIPPTPGSLEP